MIESNMKKTWTNWRKANYEFFHKYLGDRYECRLSTKRLLDLGSGELQFEGIFRKYRYTGVDFKPYPHVSIVADLTKDIPIVDGGFDIVTLSNTIEHIPNTSHLLSECYRLLSSGGIIIGTVPFLTPEHQLPYDFNRYTHIQLARMLEEAGFKDVVVESLGDQMDVYNTIELKVFDELCKSNPSITLKLARVLRRTEMRLLRWLFSGVPASPKTTEGYGFIATKV